MELKARLEPCIVSNSWRVAVLLGVSFVMLLKFVRNDAVSLPGSSFPYKGTPGLDPCSARHPTPSGDPTYICRFGKRETAVSFSTFELGDKTTSYCYYYYYY